jgi:hypothetical protein
VSPGGALTEEETAKAREAILYQEGLLKTFTADFEVLFEYPSCTIQQAIPPPQDNTRLKSMQYKYRWKDGMRRVDLEGTDMAGNTAMKSLTTVNRSRVMTLSPPTANDKQYGIVAEGVIHGDIGPDNQYVPQKFMLVGAAGGRLSEKFKQGDAEITGTETIDGKSLLGIRVKLSEGPGGTAMVYVDPEHNYALARAEYLGLDDKPAVVVRVLKFDASGDIQFPTEATATLYFVDQEGKRAKGVEARMRVLNWAVNVTLRDDLFTQTFPVGTRIYDEILKYGYVSGRETVSEIGEEAQVEENSIGGVTASNIADAVKSPEVRKVSGTTSRSPRTENLTGAKSEYAGWPEAYLVLAIVGGFGLVAAALLIRFIVKKRGR